MQLRNIGSISGPIKLWIVTPSSCLGCKHLKSGVHCSKTSSYIVASAHIFYHASTAKDTPALRTVNSGSASRAKILDCNGKKKRVKFRRAQLQLRPLKATWTAFNAGVADGPELSCQAKFHWKSLRFDPNL